MLSVSIISFNEEKNIARTLDAIKDIAHEIIIVDSHSSDKTAQIAKTYGAKVFIENWKGHVAQKNSALDKCTSDWVLCLDCDEVITPALQTEIKETINGGSFEAYSINRRTVYLDKILRHAWQPDRKFRLFKRELNPRWGGYDPHDVLQTSHKIQPLKGELLHYSYADIADHFARTVSYARITANSFYKEGRKFKWHKLLLSPIFSFIKDYIIRLGFLDGFAGLIAGVSAPIYVFLKYAFLRELEMQNNLTQNNSIKDNK